MKYCLWVLLVINFSCHRKTISVTEGADSPKTEMTRIYPDDSFIQYTGRIDFSNEKKPAFSYPGVSIKAKFQGSALDILLKDYGITPHFNFYTILIDGQIHSVLKLNKDTLYEIARGLSDDTHTVEIFKRTESLVGKSEFLGFQLQKGKTLLPSESLPARKIEFIGNSITCGYGNEGKDEFQKFSDSTENNFMAYGAITSRNLNARYLATCYSGKGIYRNYGGSQVDPLPKIYDRIFPHDSLPVWNFSNYIPDVVVINLGTNDFSQSGTDSSLFVGAYKSFIERIRNQYPEAKIFCVLGPMLSDYHPIGEQAWTRATSYVSALVEDLKRKGDRNLFYFTFTPQGKFGMGADYHPNIKQHIYNAEELTEFIKLKTGW